jgi:hypothetical protein
VDHLTELHGTRQEAVGALTGRFATREDEVDDLFRLGVFVDLYRVIPDPPLESLRVAPERARHILDGDRWGGGHRHGTDTVNESEVIERVEALPDRYAGRVRPQDLDGMRSMADGGEWQELVDVLIASLATTQAGVTSSLWDRDESRSGTSVMSLRPATYYCGRLRSGRVPAFQALGDPYLDD